MPEQGIIGLDWVRPEDEEADHQRVVAIRVKAAQEEFDAATVPLVQPLYRSALAEAARKEFDAATVPLVEQARALSCWNRVKAAWV